MAAVSDRAAGLRNVSWRPLTVDDLVYIAALEAQIHAVPWSYGNFRDALSAGYSALVGECGGRILAFGIMMRAPGEAQILNLSVVPDARRRGLGRALLARFVDDALHTGAEQVFLEVRVSNTAAIALYESEGFARVAKRAGYYPTSARASAEDALVMRRLLHPSSTER
ncbi:MAG TPA: ribosomal protein S18-alanine N-acetyltransferase [Casimicrobiaceae bacterium]|nr:ribosomal protein S18-alanine N-acetyltransferase [Casimicrobiaceae bacterium]